jgi:thioredoxin reductase (NADPH)
MQQVKLAIIGSGPAGYSAAIYASRSQLNPILFSGHEVGGQLMYTTEVENFPGFSQGIMGPKLMTEMKLQAERFGTSIESNVITAVDFSQEPFKLWTRFPSGYSVDDFRQAKLETIKKMGNELRQTEPDLETQAVIVSTGAAAMRLGVPGEDKFLGRGVSVCAVCDAAFFKDKKVYVIGGGDSAMEDALALAKFTPDVTIIHRRDEFRACKIMQERVLNNDHIQVMWSTTLESIEGKEMVEQIVVKQEDKVQTLAADGVFLAIGHQPVSSIFEGQLQLDEKKYIVTAQNYSAAGIALAQKRLNQSGLVNYPTMTSVKGVFAAGDVVDLHYQQAITAAGSGAMAALDVEKWLAD